MPKWWPFGKKEKSVEAYMNELREWSENEMAGGKTRHEVWLVLLQDNLGKNLSINELQARSAVAQEHSMIFFERGQEARHLESEGDIDGAIELYKQDLAEGSPGSGSYERLRVIYAKRKEYEKAIEVCELYANRFPDKKGGSKKAAKFAEWAEKYQEKLGK